MEGPAAALVIEAKLSDAASFLALFSRSLSTGLWLIASSTYLIINA